jgi:uncharacterized membrane protein YeiH
MLRLFSRLESPLKVNLREPKLVYGIQNVVKQKRGFKIPPQLHLSTKSSAVVSCDAPREGLPRWPSLSSTGILRSLDWFGTVIFAASGSLTAASAGCDLFGCAMIGTITAVGGGTWRDAIILNKQPFWFEEWEYILISIFTASLLFYGWSHLIPGKEIIPNSGLVIKTAEGGEGSFMDWGDAIGLGAFAVIGAMNGIRSKSPFLVSAICGLMTATFGGMTRDALLSRPVRIMNPFADVYAPISFATASAYLALHHLATSSSLVSSAFASQLRMRQGLRIGACISLAVVLRYNSWTYGWRLPFWNSEGKVTMTNHDPRHDRV